MVDIIREVLNLKNEVLKWTYPKEYVDDELANKADIDHVHDNYANVDHTHNGYANSNHTHSQYYSQSNIAYADGKLTITLSKD